MPKSARERLAEKKEPKKVVLDKDFAGVKRGQMLFVATPAIIADYIAKIPYGETRTVERMRGELARRRRCDATCPVSTAIFIRIAAQVAVDDMDEGKAASDVIPFWRLIDGQHKIARKLTIDGRWIDERRQLEQQAV